MEIPNTLVTLSTQETRLRESSKYKQHENRHKTRGDSRAREDINPPTNKRSKDELNIVVVRQSQHGSNKYDIVCSTSG